MLMPPVSRYMTDAPISVTPEITMRAAHDLMRRRSIRHLPIVRDGHLVGIVTDRDLHQHASVPHFDPDRVTVEEVMVKDVAVVSPRAGLQAVAELMHGRDLGSVVVVDRDRVVGIFTTNDALRALCDIVGREA
jgi:acetoin utilization protein AcuB